MATKIINSYIKWVRENGENATSLERFTQMLAMILADPKNLITKELAWTLVRLHSFSNSTIIETGGRAVAFTEKVAIITKTIPEMECLLELLLRQYCGHGIAWNVLLILQSVKCFLNLLVHRQLFLAPWIWAALRRRIQIILIQISNVPNAGRRLSATFASRLLKKITGGDGYFSQSSPLIQSSRNNNNNNMTPLVIPRVAARRLHHNTAADHNNNNNINNSERNKNESSESLPCTALDLLGLVVDLILLLRPLLLLYCAKRAFPTGAMDIAALPRLFRNNNNNNNSSSTNSNNLPEITEEDNTNNNSSEGDGLFVLRAALKDGPGKSLLSNWTVWLSFFGLDAILAMVSRYIRRHRVPVVYIKNENSPMSGTNNNNNNTIHTNDGEAASRSEDETNNNNNNNNSSTGHNGHSSISTFPPLPRPPVNDVATHFPIISRDSLRVQQALRNIAYSFLHDPFFPAVLQKFIYEHFVMGRLSRIPLLGPILSYQVAYFLCKQHYCFMYFLGQ